MAHSKDEKPTCVCFWCGDNAELVTSGHMAYLLYDKYICASCWKKHNHLLIMFHSGLRRDGRRPVFQLPLL